MGMYGQEKMIDASVWTLNDQERLLSRGMLVFRYSPIRVERVGFSTPVEWEQQRANGEFELVADPNLIKELNSALRVREAVLEDSTARKVLRC